MLSTLIINRLEALIISCNSHDDAQAINILLNCYERAIEIENQSNSKKNGDKRT